MDWIPLKLLTEMFYHNLIWNLETMCGFNNWYSRWFLSQVNDVTRECVDYFQFIGGRKREPRCRVAPEVSFYMGDKGV